jgi:hypothetical protein
MRGVGFEGVRHTNADANANHCLLHCRTWRHGGFKTDLEGRLWDYWHDRRRRYNIRKRQALKRIAEDEQTSQLGVKNLKQWSEIKRRIRHGIRFLVSDPLQLSAINRYI